MTEEFFDPQVALICGPIVAGLFCVAAVVAVVRIIRGPAIMDRVIGTDILLASILGGLGSYIALSGRSDLLPVLLAAAMFAFVGTVAVSRYVSRNSAALDYSQPAEEPYDQDGSDVEAHGAQGQDVEDDPGAVSASVSEQENAHRQEGASYDW